MSRISAGPRQIRAGLQSRDDRVVVIVTYGPFGILVGNRHPDVAMRDAPRRDRKRRRHDANHGVCLAVERERAADRIR
jgi:hypothetical protein